MSLSAIANNHKHLLLGTALVGAFVASYGRRAYAGSCVVGSPGVFTCSGAAGADTTQALTGAPLTVTTTASFGINTAVGNAFTLTGTNGLAFTDAQGSTITGAGDGIYGRNNNSGALSITTTGTVTGGTRAGIGAVNRGTDLTIHAADVSGALNGINAHNFGAGALTITATGTVAGTTEFGIVAKNYGTNTVIDVSSSGSVAGAIAGVIASSYAGQAIGITNAGTIRTLSGVSADLAITTTNGPTTIANTGLVLGTVDLGDLDDGVSNSGTWNTANGANDFGAGTDVVTNLGTTIAANDSGLAEVTRFLGALSIAA